MIHNRTVKEVRRYDIFKLIVLLVLLLLLIFVVWRDEEELSEIATGEDSPPSSEVEEGYPGPESDAYPGEASDAYPADDGEAAYPGGEAPPVPAPELPSESSTDEAPYPPQEEPEQQAPQETPGYPGPDTGDQPPAEDGDATESPEEPGAADAEQETESGDAQTGDTVDETSGDTTAGQSDESADAPIEPAPEQARETSIDEDALFAGASVIGGMGTPGSTVVILAGDQEIAAAEVGRGGTWSAPVELETGSQTIILQTISENGEIESESEPIEVTVRERVLPTINLPERNVYAYGLTLTGTGQPRSPIQIIADDETLTQTTVNEDGEWTADINLEEGTYNIDVAALDNAGNIIDQIPGLSLPVLPLAFPRLRIAPEMPEFDPIAGLIVWRGAAVPGTEVAVVVNGSTVGTAVADDQGQWTVDTSLDPGVYDITLAEIDEGGAVTGEADPESFDLSVDPPEFDFPQDVLEFDDNNEAALNLTAGAITWNGQAEANRQVAVVINHDISVTVTADETGNWSVKDQVQEGDSELQLGLLDENGEFINLSEPILLKVAPSPVPVIDTIKLDAGNGNVDIIGSTTPDTTVNLLINGGVLTTQVSDPEGNFIFEIRLSPGTYEIQVESLDADGNVAYTSAPQTLQVTKSEETTNGAETTSD
ncbi:MAG: Ig-like domain-containing protein [Candidatus Promineifilaceae bacterium]|nr:Ig-like domain-containing protein [Candidatus Promineifilaceae bacterium]